MHIAISSVRASRLRKMEMRESEGESEGESESENEGEREA